MPAFWGNITKNRLCDLQVRPGARIAWLGGINKFLGGHKIYFESESVDQKTKFFITKFHEIWGRPKKSLHLKKCANFHEFWGETTKKSAKKQFLLTNSEVITIILEVSGLEVHSSGTEPVTFFGAQSSLGGHNSRLGGGAQALIWGGTAWEYPTWRPACWKFTAIYRTATIAFSLKRCYSKSVSLKKWELFEVIRRCPKSFSTIPLFAKIRFNSFDSVPLATLYSQFCDITKGITLQKFLQTKKCNYQLVAVSSLSITKSENFAIVTGTCKPRLLVLIYSTPFAMSQNCEK